jgi:hypothetical protein
MDIQLSDLESAAQYAQKTVKVLRVLQLHVEQGMR